MYRVMPILAAAGMASTATSLSAQSGTYAFYCWVSHDQTIYHSQVWVGRGIDGTEVSNDFKYHLLGREIPSSDSSITFSACRSFRTTDDARAAMAKDGLNKRIVSVDWSHRDLHRGGTRVTTTKRTAPVPSPSTDGSRPPTPNQLKYQRELEAHRQRLAEIERVRADRAAQLERNRRQAEQVLDQHKGDMQQHRQEVAAADAARRRYEQELAAHQSAIEKLQKQQDRDQKVDWREAVVVCTLSANNPQSQFGNWRCDGPLQFTYAKLGATGNLSPQTLIALSQACGGSTRSIRDLGLVGIYRVFGCSFGLHPEGRSGASLDAAAKYGLGYIPGRAVYRCSRFHPSCRTY